MKGRTNNPNGRPKGTPNKVTGELRDWVSKFIDGNRKRIQTDWLSLEPRDRVILFEKLLKYCLPTLQATKLTSDFGKMSDEDLDQIINRLKNQNHDQGTKD